MCVIHLHSICDERRIQYSFTVSRPSTYSHCYCCVLPGSHLSTCVTFGDAGKFCRLMTDTLLTPRAGDVCTTMACCEEYAPMHRVQQMHGKQKHNQALLLVKDSREAMIEQQSVIVATKVSFASFSGGSWLFGRTPAALPRFLTAISVAAAMLDRQW